jgi:hypothetical protein
VPFFTMLSNHRFLNWPSEGDMNKKREFKAGDKVRITKLIGGDHPRILGSVVTLRERRYLRDADWSIEEILAGLEGATVAERQIELVEDQAPSLQELVDNANKALTALRTVDVSQIEVREAEADDKWRSTTLAHRLEYRVKHQKPKEMTLKDSNYRVTISSNDVTVGCRIFNKSNLEVCLRTLVHNEASACSDFYASRTGVRHGSEIISWWDAEQLLKFLEWDRGQSL